MKKSMRTMLVCLGILFGSIILYKVIMGIIFKRYMASYSQTVTVSALKATYSSWQPQLSAAASLRAVRGVNVTTQVTGLVQHIYFTPGAVVKEGTVLLTLDADDDIAHLHSLEATSELAKITYERDKKLYDKGAISKSQLDTDEATLKSAAAQVIEQAAVTAKKTITAPFSGRLGISNVDPGQYLNAGDKIVTLQAIEPIYADFYVPQQLLTQLKTGMPVQVLVDAFPGQIFKGRITTIEPLIDTSTRNGQIEATIENPRHTLVPGMFASVTVNTGEAARYLTLPQTAVSYNPYGNIVYIIQKSHKDKKHPLTVVQTFVKTGQTRGDQVAILSGLKEEDLIVTSGQLKLKNNTPVVIDNTVVPNNNPSPQPVDE
jgi:membrane fusion protein (multidrug efflux system)